VKFAKYGIFESRQENETKKKPEKLVKKLGIVQGFCFKKEGIQQGISVFCPRFNFVVYRYAGIYGPKGGGA
jgi:hypothetical protein